MTDRDGMHAAVTPTGVISFRYQYRVPRNWLTAPWRCVDLDKRLTATLTALKRNRAARYRHQAARARHDMRSWQIERRKRTRHLIELGGLVVKAGIVDLTDDDRATIYGALLWMADKLKSEDGERARGVWTAKGKQAFGDG